MRYVSIVTVFWLLLPSLINAKLGETRPQVATRYGRPVDRVADIDIHRTSIYTVVVVYDHSFSVVETVYKTPKRTEPASKWESPHFDSAGDFSETETGALLATYSEDQAWEHADEYPDAWKRADGKVVVAHLAHQDPITSSVISADEKYAIEATPSLTFANTAFLAALKQRQEQTNKVAAERQQREDAQRIVSAFGASSTLTPTPSPASPAESSSAKPLIDLVAESRRRAVEKYPALAVANSPMNAMFVAEYKRLEAARDPVLNAPDWPERLADGCALTEPTPAPTPAKAGWSTARPPYPTQARLAHVQGSGVLLVKTDKTGRVASVTVTQSAGSAILDSCVAGFAKSNWSGPPDSEQTFPFSFALK